MHCWVSSTLKMKTMQEHPAKNRRKGFQSRHSSKLLRFSCQTEREQTHISLMSTKTRVTIQSRIRQFQRPTNLCQKAIFISLSRFNSCRYRSLTDQKSEWRVVLNKLLFTSSSQKTMWLLTQKSADASRLQRILWAPYLFTSSYMHKADQLHAEDFKFSSHRFS